MVKEGKGLTAGEHPECTNPDTCPIKQTLEIMPGPGQEEKEALEKAAAKARGTEFPAHIFNETCNCRICVGHRIRNYTWRA